MSTPLVIAIDGPAGSGKSTVASALAGRLSLATLDTGATYRAVAAAVVERGIDPEDASAVAKVAKGATLEIEGRVIVGITPDHQPSRLGGGSQSSRP